MKSLKIAPIVAVMLFAAMYWTVGSTPLAAPAPPVESKTSAQPNPNQGKVWNRTKVKIGGVTHEVVTMENVPGVVCTFAQQSHYDGEALNASVSCVRR